MIRHELTRAQRRDPTTFIGAFAMWCCICAVSLLLPNDVFSNVSVYNTMRTIHPNEMHWGILMLTDGILLTMSLFIREAVLRSMVALLSAVLWTLVGSLLILGAWEQGYFSIVGANSIVGAVGCLLAVGQWVHSEAD